MLKSIPHWLLRLFLLFLTSYGMLYFSYKYYTPWGGGSDFTSYYPMYLKPLDFSVADVPFVFRQLSACLTHLVYQMGIYYPNHIFFEDSRFDQRIFFAAIFSNYLCLIATSWLAGIAVNILSRTNSLIYPLIAGFFCFLSFFTQVTVLTGLTEGLSWLMLTAGFIFYLQRRLLLLSVILLLAVFQRETIIIVFGVIAAFGLVNTRNEEWYANLKVFGWALLCFILYIGMHKFSGVPGNGGQTDLTALLTHLQLFRPTREIVFQGVLSQNLLVIYGLLCPMLIRYMPEQKFWMPALLTTIVVLIIVGIAAGIGNNVGRICGILTPIFAIFVSKALLHIEGMLVQDKNRYQAQQAAPADTIVAASRRQ